MKKSNTLLQQIFRGELYPAETIRNPEWKKILNAITAEREYLSGKLSETDKERLQKIDDLYQEYNNTYGDECFACGFRLGALLMIEIFGSQTSGSEQAE